MLRLNSASFSFSIFNSSDSIGHLRIKKHEIQCKADFEDHLKFPKIPAKYDFPYYSGNLYFELDLGISLTLVMVIKRFGFFYRIF